MGESVGFVLGGGVGPTTGDIEGRSERTSVGPPLGSSVVGPGEGRAVGVEIGVMVGASCKSGDGPMVGL